MSNGITKENLLRQFPAEMARTEELAALAAGTAEILARSAGGLEKLRMYTNTAEMDEAMADILAKDLNVYWYDQNASLAQKRKMIASAPAVSRVAGTTAATRRQVESLYQGTTIEEWFKYDGTPGTFRLYINLEASGGEELEKMSKEELEKALLQSKRYSAHLAEVKYINAGGQAAAYGAAKIAGAALVDYATAVKY